MSLNKSPRKRGSAHAKIVAGLIALSFVSIFFLGATKEKTLIVKELPNGSTASYSLIDQEPQKDIEVFFWYGCPHCLNLEESFERSRVRDRVIRSGYSFTRTPLPANPRWEIHARLYHALEHFGVNDRIHLLVMKEIQTHRITTSSEIKSMLQRLHSQGRFGSVQLAVSPDDIMMLLNDELINQKIIETKNRAREYSITGVPTVIAEGNKKLQMSSRMRHEDIASFVLELTGSSR